jgi:hypothetical protein
MGFNRPKIFGFFVGNVQQNGAAIHSKRATKEVFHQQNLGLSEIQSSPIRFE